MALEVVLKKGCILGFGEVYAMTLELALELRLTLDDVFFTTLLLEP